MRLHSPGLTAERCAAKSGPRNRRGDADTSRRPAAETINRDGRRTCPARQQAGEQHAAIVRVGPEPIFYPARDVPETAHRMHARRIRPDPIGDIPAEQTVNAAHRHIAVTLPLSGISVPSPAGAQASAMTSQWLTMIPSELSAD